MTEATLQNRQTTLKNRTIFCGDCLDVLKGFNNNSIDLIYLDPPFNKKKQFTAPIGSDAEGAEFKDYWGLEDIKNAWLLLLKERHIELYNFIELSQFIGDKSNKYYLVYMAMRLLEMKRILKDTGSIYLHCDNTIGHFLKLLMDVIFGHNNFRNMITWKRADAHNDAKKKYATVSDNILFYTKSSDYFFNIQYLDYPEKTLKDWYLFLEFPDGTIRKMTKEERETQEIPKNAKRFNADNLTGPKQNPNDLEWRGYHPGSVGRSWSLAKETVVSLVGAEKQSQMNCIEKLNLLYEHGHIYHKEGNVPMLKRYLDKQNGPLVTDLWTNITQLRGTHKERLGYPTQKPLALLERIIKASCPQGGIVLDPFCGCATTCVAAEKLEREWVGIDISKKAFELVNLRLKREIVAPDRFFTIEKSLIFRDDIPERTDVDYKKLVGKYKKEMKETLYGKQHGNCAGCKQHFHIIHMEVDHILPRAKGGSDSEDNLQLLCNYCNRVKGDRSMEELLAKLKAIV